MKCWTLWTPSGARCVAGKREECDQSCRAVLSTRQRLCRRNAGTPLCHSATVDTGLPRNHLQLSQTTQLHRNARNWCLLTTSSVNLSSLLDTNTRWLSTYTSTTSQDCNTFNSTPVCSYMWWCRKKFHVIFGVVVLIVEYIITSVWSPQIQSSLNHVLLYR